MDAFVAGLQAMGRNARVVAAYIVGSILLAMVSLGVSYLFVAGPLKGTDETVTRVVSILQSLYSAASYAALNAIAFSLLGKDIDRPLWRYHGWLVSLQRFFTPWFILSLAYIMVLRVMIRFGRDSPAAEPLLMLACIIFALHLPFGVAIMHQGKFEWRAVPAALAPLFIQLPRMAIPTLAGLMLFFFSFFNGPAVHPRLDGDWGWLYRAPLLYLLIGLTTCAIVTTTWCVLILHRDHEDEDFDL